jgi:DNA-binding GntR family transcriptional regulator
MAKTRRAGIAGAGVDHDTPQAGGERAARIYGLLRDLIVQGRLAPGIRITEAEVVARFGASRTPVRSALQRLHHEGYVAPSENSRRPVATVAPLTRRDATELLNIIGELEALAGRSAAQLPQDRRAKTATELRKINARLKATAARHPVSTDRFYQLDEAFHRCLFEAGAGPRLTALHRSMKPQAGRYTQLYVAALSDEILASVREHETIVKALAAGDPDATQRSIEVNWRNSIERLCQVIDRMGERGRW